MFRDVRDLFSVIFDALRLFAKLMFILFILLIPALIALVLNNIFGLTISTIIILTLCSVMVIVGLYWLYKIWTNPNLSRTQKWNRSFGKNYT